MAANEMHAIKSRIGDQIKANKKRNNWLAGYHKYAMLYGCLTFLYLTHLSSIIDQVRLKNLM